MFPLSLAIAQQFTKKRGGGGGGTGTMNIDLSGAIPSSIYVYYYVDTVPDNSDLGSLSRQNYESPSSPLDVTTWFQANGAGTYVFAGYYGSGSDFAGNINLSVTSETPGGVTTVQDLYCRDSTNLPGSVDTKVQALTVTDGDALLGLFLDFPS